MPFSMLLTTSVTVFTSNLKKMSVIYGILLYINISWSKISVVLEKYLVKNCLAKNYLVEPGVLEPVDG